jgi:hypothetical protein
MSGLTLILVLGIAAQVVGWYTRIPSIVILIGAGLLAGPVFGWLQPEAVFGDLLTPFISLSVAIILFEGGLSLKLEEIKRTARVVTRLITLGVVHPGEDYPQGGYQVDYAGGSPHLGGRSSRCLVAIGSGLGAGNPVIRHSGHQRPDSHYAAAAPFTPAGRYRPHSQMGRYSY